MNVDWKVFNKRIYDETAFSSGIPAIWGKINSLVVLLIIYNYFPGSLVMMLCFNPRVIIGGTVVGFATACVRNYIKL